VKIKNKLPQFSESFHSELIENKWVPLKEPKNLINAIFLSIPFMIINAFITVGIMNIFSNVSLKDFGLDHNSISYTINLKIIFFFILLLILHELFHLIFIPNFIKSKNTFVGITLVGGFVSTEEKIPKSRFILVTIAPFVIISVILPLILGFCGLLTPTLKTLIILNSLASSVDILSLILIMKQVPKNGILINNGHKTYWNDNLMGNKI
jgi:hypothetical protein